MPYNDGDRIALASFPRSGNTWMRRILYSMFGWKSWCDHSEEVDEVHKSALIPEIAHRDARLIKTHLMDADGFQHCIHLVRDPQDAIASYLVYCDQWNVPRPPLERFLREEAEGWAKHTAFWRNRNVVPGVHIGIRYEDLLRRPSDVCYAIANGLGLGARVSWKTIESALDNTDFQNLQRRSGSAKFYREGKIGTAGKVLSPYEISIIRRICADGMISVGYVP